MRAGTIAAVPYATPPAGSLPEGKHLRATLQAGQTIRPALADFYSARFD